MRVHELMQRITFAVCFLAVANAAVTFTLKRELAKPESRGLLGRIRDIFGGKLHNTHDVIYKGTVYVGTPAKEFNVVFDTGSGLFWLPWTGCKSSGPHADACKNDSRTYDPKESKTSRKSGRTFSMHYGTGKSNGKIFMDTVQFGNLSEKHLTLENVEIGAARRATYIDHGIVGLSLPDRKNPKPLFFTAVEQGLMDEPIFTTFMRKCDGECDDGGAVTLGGFDDEHCVKEELHWTRVVSGTSMWRFALTGMKVGKLSVTNLKKFAITDTGTSYIQIPTKVFRQVVDELKAEKMDEYYVMPCDSTFEMEFTIDGKAYKVTEKEVLLNQGYGPKCVVAIGDAGMFDMFLLGDAFVRGWCQVYDIKNRKVGFAPVKH